MVVKSDKPPIGWLKPEKMGCFYHRFQLEKDFATIHRSYGKWLIKWMIQPLKMLIFHGYVRLLEGTYYLLG